jgi:putative oxidoreductase
MASSSVSTSSHTSQGARIVRATRSNEQASASSFVTLAGRILFSVIFVMAGLFHFSSQEIAYAANAGVPIAGFLVPASGVIAMLGGLSILLGYRAKIGAWLVVFFLVPVTFMMHNFWAMKDAMMAQMQMAMFMKNVTIIGGALLISQFGAGPLSLDARRNSTR